MNEVVNKLKPDDKLPIINIPSWKNVAEDIEKKLRKCIEDNTYVDRKDGGEYGYEVYIDRRYPTFCDQTLAKISKEGTNVATDQFDYLFENYTFSWEIDTKDEKEDEICKEFEKIYPDEFANYEDEIRELIREIIYAYVDSEDLNQEVDVVITLDVGDMNYDFSCNNTFNEWSGYDNELNNLSPIVWVARNQKKLTELKKAIKNNDFERGKKFSEFTKSCIRELENQFHCMSCMSFLVRMGLNDYIKLQGMIRRQDKLNETIDGAKYYYDLRPDSGEYIVMGKDVECGLFNPWIGGGSLLEIELEKDIKIPMKAIWSAWIEAGVHGCCPLGYSIDEVYGINRSVFDTEVELHGKNYWE